MKRICYITTISLTIRSFFIPQLKYLSENGFDVTVICSSDDELQGLLGENINYIPVEMVRGISPKNIIKTVSALKNIFKRERFDLIQYSTPNAAFCAAIAGVLSKVKIRNYHLMGLRYLGNKGVQRIILKLLEKMTCILSTNIECVSKTNLDLGVQEKLFKPEKSAIVWNGSSGGVDLTRFDYKNRDQWRKVIRERYSIKEDEFVFGFVGRITRDKGINEILEAFGSLDADAKLLIVGSKEGIHTLKRPLWDDACNSKNIIIVDSVNDVEKYYAAMDMLLLPSYREGFGMVIAEAAAMGTPAIVSNIPGPIDVIDEGKTAFTVEVRNTEDLVDKMKSCLKKREIIREMSGNASGFIKNRFDANILSHKIYERKLYLLNMKY